MFIVWIVKNIGLILLAVAIVLPVSLLMKARRMANQEREVEIADIIRSKEESRRKEAEARRLAAAKAEKEAAASAAKSFRKEEQARQQAEKKEAKQARIDAAAQKRAERLEAARQLAEYNERALAAARALRTMQSGTSAPASLPKPPASIRPVVTSAPATSANPSQTSAAPSKPVTSAPANAPKPFTNQRVSFTGRLFSMTRKEAVEKVKLAGGIGYEKDMPASTTILVVGDTRGNDTRKLEKADEWIGHIRKITEAQFLNMLKTA